MTPEKGNYFVIKVEDRRQLFSEFVLDLILRNSSNTGQEKVQLREHCLGMDQSLEQIKADPVAIAQVFELQKPYIDIRERVFVRAKSLVDQKLHEDDF